MIILLHDIAQNVCLGRREMKDGSTMVAGARLLPMAGYDAAMALFERGTKARTVGG